MVNGARFPHFIVRAKLITVGAVSFGLPDLAEFGGSFVPPGRVTEDSPSAALPHRADYRPEAFEARLYAPG